MKTIGLTRPAALLAAACALAVSGCGSSSTSSKSSTSAAAQSPARTTSGSSGGYRGYGGGTTSASASSAGASGAGGTSGPGVTVVAKSNKLGKILAAGPKRLTVYLFEGDHAGASACSGACASVWPPVTGSGRPGAGVNASDLGTITRSDGRTQVTYKGHPLYYFARDGDNGDAYGEGIKGFGASWYVLAPSGKKIDNS